MRRFSGLSSTVENAEETPLNSRIIDISDGAMAQLSHLIGKNPDKQILRMGVKAGGCSGMSYTMDLITEDDIHEDDHREVFEGVSCVVDPKSVLFIYGMQLDYSDEMIGGGFKFQNPNAEKSCGCGKSFGV
jgi:iron-sulfur cluster assembly accessory protein